MRRPWRLICQGLLAQCPGGLLLSGRQIRRGQASRIQTLNAVSPVLNLCQEIGACSARPDQLRWNSSRESVASVPSFSIFFYGNSSPSRFPLLTGNQENCCQKYSDLFREPLFGSAAIQNGKWPPVALGSGDAGSGFYPLGWLRCRPRMTRQSARSAGAQLDAAHDPGMAVTCCVVIEPRKRQSTESGNRFQRKRFGAPLSRVPISLSLFFS